MLRHTISEEPTYPSQYVPVPRKDEMSEAHIEDYLDHFCAPLIGKVSYEERAKMREELRAQIESVVAAHIELGSTREQAIALTLQQFSHVPAVSAELPVHQHIVTPSLLAQQQTSATKLRSGLVTGLACTGVSILLQGLTTFSVNHGISPGTDALLTALMASYPILAGLTLGYRRPDRPLRTLAKSLAWLALPTLIVNAIVMYDPYRAHMHPAGFTAIVLFGNLVFGGIGVKIGAWIRQSGLLDKIDPPAPARLRDGSYRMQ